MIIVKIFSGLGNQMFQYAFARSLSLKTGIPFKMDISALPDKFGRTYLLDKFDINAVIADRREIRHLSEPRFSFLKRIFAKISGAERPRPKTYKKERRDYVYDEGMLLLEEDAYYDGYWQNQKYFTDHRDIIKRDLAFKEQPDARNFAILKEIQDANSVSVHVRRGDYLASAPSARTHGICSPDYYQKAAEMIASKIKDPVFYIFSDEPEWVRKEFDIKHRCIIVDNNTDRPQEDLRLMSACKHNIIANSTFSWWAAWLNMNPSKIVVAPQKWVVKDNVDASDIVLAGWIKI